MKKIIFTILLCGMFSANVYAAKVSSLHTWIDGETPTAALWNANDAAFTLAIDNVESAQIVDGTIVNADIANSTIDLTTKVTGTMPIANGGTGTTNSVLTNFYVDIRDGTVDAPSFAFNGDRDNGIYYVTTNTWGLVSGGAEIVRFTGTTQSSGFLNGITVGVLAYTDANHFDTTTAGSDSTTMYIGNKTIDTSASDKRKKGNIKETTKGLDLLNKIKVYDFKWKKEFDSKDTKQHIGVMAQELFVLDESLAKKPDDEETGLWTTSKDDLIALLIKSVQELSVKVDDLEKRVNVLENK